MANIDRIVDVQISLNTTGISSEGFSTICVIGPHAYSTTRVLAVTDSDELLDMGFESTNPIYLAVNDAFGQTPRPAVVKVGRIQCDTIKAKIAAGSVVDASTYGITLSYVDADGNSVTQSFSATADSEATVTSVLTALSNAVMADESAKLLYSASVVDTELVIKANDPTHSFILTPSALMEVSVFEEAADIDLAENMALITAADDDFYGIIYTKRTQDDIIAMADWVESHTKLYFVAIDEDGFKNAEVTTDTASKLMSGNYFRTAPWYHKNAAADFLDSAIMAVGFAVQPGGETYALKRLGGVTTDTLREHEAQAVFKKNGNTFERIRNISVTQNGKVAAGEWIDVIRFRDWLCETIKTEVFSALINRDKLPYTDNGIALVQSVINGVLALGQRRNGIAPTEYDADGNKNLGYVISVPLAANISANVKAQRKLTDVKFTARLAGAIHAIEIRGSLTFENIIQKA